jgi:transcriptional regulator with XRE-family HTH domain
MMVRTPPQLSPTPTLQERFGRNLWRCRRRADLSQEDLAKLVGLSRPAIYGLEQGEKLPRLDTILKLAAGIEVSPCVLLAGMQWRPGYYVYVEGEFEIEHPAAQLRRSVQC